MLNTARIMASLWVAGLRGGLEYRVDFLLQALMGLVWQGTGFILIWVILARFDTLAGWTLGEIALLYGMRMAMLGLCGLATGNIWGLQSLVRRGEFDRYLVRPIHPVLQLLTLRVPMSAFGDLFGGVVLIAVAASRLDLAWTPAMVLYLLLALAGGALVLLAVRLLFVSFAFRAITVYGLMGIIDDLFNQFGTYPLSIFNTTVQWLLTFVMPVAFMAYFPTAVLLQRTGELNVVPLLAYAAPLAGVVWLAIALWVFRREMRNYQSAGH